MTDDTKQRIRETLQAMAMSHFAAASQFEMSLHTLTSLLNIDPLEFSKLHRIEQAKFANDVKNPRHVLIDPATLSIIWKGERCFLGNTLLFRLFIRLAQTPNEYVSHQKLLDEVWKGRREGATIRGVVKRLRDTLSDAGMQDLAKAIDGSSPGFYRLKLV